MRKMHRYVLCFIVLLSNVYCDSHALLVLDYFTHKRVTSVVGFSCDVIRDDVTLMRSFNRFGMTTVIINPSSNRSIDIYAKSIYWKIGIFVDLSCNDEKILASILSKAGDKRLYDELHNWLIIGNEIEDVLKIVNDDSFGMSTDFVIAIPSLSVSNDTYLLYDAYNIWKERGGPFNLTYMGFWKRNDNFYMNFVGPKYMRRANLFGLPMRTSFFYSKFKPENMSLNDYLQEFSLSSKDRVSKYGFAIVTHLSEMFNFKLITLTAKWEIGETTGPVIRSLMNNDSDLSGTPVPMSIKRTYQVRFVHQSRPFRTCFIFRNPQPKVIKAKEVFGPLEVQVWYATLIISGATIWILATLYKYEEITNTLERYSEASLTILGSLCQQGTETRMENISTRIAYLYITIFSLLLYNYYGACIVGVKLNESIFKMNDSLNELAKSGLNVSSETMPYFELYMKRQDWETQTFYKNVWQNMREEDQFMEPEKGIKLVKEGGFAYHVHPDIGYPIINRFFDNREICELMEVHLARLTYATFAVGRNSTFTEIIRVGLTKISEVGIRHRLLQRYSTIKPKCLETILSASSIDIYEFAPHLILLFFGFFLAFIIFLLEIMCKRKKQIF